MNYVVLHDPKGKFAEGQVTDPHHARNLKLDGAALLPVFDKIIGKHGCSGFFSRHWGTGTTYHPVIANRGCPMSLFLVNEPNVNTLYWCARIVPNGEVDEPSGQLRLMPDSSTGTNGVCGFNMSPTNCADLSKLGEPDSEGGWNVYGSVPISIQMNGVQSLMLYGFARGYKVLWTAVTQAEQQ